jgi:signal transduction histidine kinase
VAAWKLPLKFTLRGQVLALVAVSILAAEVAGLVVVFTLPPRPMPTVPMTQVLDRARLTLKVIEAAQPAEAARIARAASGRLLVFSFTTGSPAPLADPYSERVRTVAAMGLDVPVDEVRVIEMRDDGGIPSTAAAPPEARVEAAQSFSNPKFALLGKRVANGDDLASMVLPYGRRGLALKATNGWLLAHTAHAPDIVWLRQVSLTFALTLAALLAPALWLGGRIAERIRAFAEGAERFGVNPNAPLLPEEGPPELRQAIGAFNQMQGRIRKLVSDRTMMMAAVSHDLRSPLARIRFHIADLEPEARDAIAADVEQMDEMIGQILAFTREALPAAERRLFDLSALGQSLVDELADAGADVRFDGPDRLPVEANLSAVRRILSNLLDNALKYAGHARLKMERRGDQVVMLVEDDGPGVPSAMRQAVFEPFRRLEPSRNRGTGGVGLGLAIARNLARGHGGDVDLDATPRRGARFVVSLPAPAAQ